MNFVEEHVSPDGRLRFLVVEEADGDLSLGFDGFPWHTHAEILAAVADLSEDEAVRKFVDDLLNDRSVIVLLSIAGEVCDAWVSEDPSHDLDYPIPGESVELRYWSGRRRTGA